MVWMLLTPAFAFKLCLARLVALFGSDEHANIFSRATKTKLLAMWALPTRLFVSFQNSMLPSRRIMQQSFDIDISSRYKHMIVFLVGI